MSRHNSAYDLIQGQASQCFIDCGRAAQAGQSGCICAAGWCRAGAHAVCKAVSLALTQNLTESRQQRGDVVFVGYTEPRLPPVGPALR